MISLKILDEYLDNIEEEIDNPSMFADIEAIDKHLNLSSFGLNQFVNDLSLVEVIKNGKVLTNNLHDSAGTLDELVLYLKYTLHHIIIIRCGRYTFSGYVDRKVEGKKNKYMEYSDEVNVAEKHHQYLIDFKRLKRDLKIPRITEKTFLRFHLEKFYHYMDKSSLKPSIQDKIIYMLYCAVGYYINEDNNFINSDNLDEYQENNLATIKRFRCRVLNEN